MTENDTSTEQTPQDGGSELTALLPCPFCGEDDKGDYTGLGIGEMAPRVECNEIHHCCWVRCRRCGARTGIYPKKETAIEKWNMRTRPKASWAR
jgi:hypothetical protein